MSFVNYRDNSRINWGREAGDERLPDQGEIRLGCMLRIADATEAMAKNHAQMQRDLDYYKGACKRNAATIARLEKQRSSLRGVITRMKRKGAGGVS